MRSLRSIAVLFAALLGMVFAAHAQAKGPSFDCRKAVIAADRAICASAKLSQMDREMGPIYRQARRAAADRKRFDRISRRWIRARNRCASNAACLKRVYRDRRAYLTGRPVPARGAVTTTVSKAPPDKLRAIVPKAKPSEPVETAARPLPTTVPVPAPQRIRVIEPDSDPDTASILRQIDELEPGTSLTITEGWCSEYNRDVQLDSDQCRTVMLEECGTDNEICRKQGQYQLQSGRVVVLAGTERTFTLDGRPVRPAGEGCWQGMEGAFEFCMTLMPADRDDDDSPLDEPATEEN